MFNLQSPSKYSPFDTIHLLRWVFLPLKTVFELVDFDAFECFCCFLFNLFHIGKIFPFEDFFHLRKQKQFAWGKIRWVGKAGHRGHAVFCHTLSAVWAAAFTNRPSLNGQSVERLLKKKFNEAEHSPSQQCQQVQWYRWAPRTLNWEGGAMLQGPHPSEDNSWFLGDPPHPYCFL